MMVDIEPEPSPGDGRAWRDEVERTYRADGARLQRALWATFGDRYRADDAVAEAFVQLLRRGDAAGPGRDNVDDPARWVWRAAYRICRGSFVTSVDLVADVPERAGPDADPSAAGVVHGDLLALLARLPDLQRSVVVLCDYAGFSGREAAAIVGSTPGAVRVHLHRARRRLRTAAESAGLTLEVFHA